MPIQILPDEVASQIAAGEVVERPASVVKELVENSLDAGANHISITIEGAGQKLIEVADDGVGISPDQLELALTRHATSKLYNAADLQHIATLGFRGEALASIASVSRFSIVSRPKDSEAGAQLQVDGGEAGVIEPIGAPTGTVVRVEDLFYNVPARRKFLKKDATERRQIDALVTRYALAYPNVRFQLRQENRSSLQTSGNGDACEVLAALYGADVARQMLEVNADYDEVKLTGFISPTGVTRGNRREITFFVNGRWVQDYTLTAALVQAYHTMLMVGRYPVAVIFLQVDPELVDVNVHPAKSEVRFQQRDQIFSSVQRATRRALLAYTPVPTMDFNAQTRWTPVEPGTYRQRSIDPAWEMAGEATGEEEKSEEKAEEQAPLPRGDVPLLRLVGQVGSAYLVAEGPDGLYLIDQHAAHERVLFERFMQQLKEQADAIPSQALLEPVTVELSGQEASLLEDQLSVMQSLGFEVEPFGPNTFILRAIPALLLGSDPLAALRVVIEDFEEDETPLQDQIEAKVIARVCKRAAVKAGQNLSQEEQRALLRDLENSESPRTCPHGRPTMIHLSIDLLEGQFGRKGAR